VGGLRLVGQLTDVENGCGGEADSAESIEPLLDRRTQGPVQASQVSDPAEKRHRPGEDLLLRGREPVFDRLG
jgi:hypothetical protein